MTDLSQRVHAICAALQSVRVDLSSESGAQAGYAAALEGAGFHVDREVRLSAADRVDLMTLDGIVIEVKLRRGWRKTEIFKQLARYARHDRVRAVILVTGQAMTLPADVDGKPTGIVSAGRAWL